MRILSGCRVINIRSCQQTVSYPELNQWNIIHILGCLTPNFLAICVIIVTALSIFHAWIWVGVSIDKYWLLSKLDTCLNVNVLAKRNFKT
jgi:hypothetical protein